MKVIIGLGNPGKKYEATRHNIGFEVIDEIARRGGQDRVQLKFDAELIDTTLGSEKLLLVKPLTYMNLSGRSVRQIVDFYKLQLDDLLVICDDLNLDTGRLRLRGKGSSGGQKGIQNIIDQFGGRNEFARLRIGIGRPSGNLSVTDFVLKKFNKSEQEIMDVSVQLAADAAEYWTRNDLLSTMNKYNSPNYSKSNSNPPQGEKSPPDQDSKDS
ncbi:MAG: aminoacyl-tRNA hydrolase [Planctomycetaceae bacterium]